MALEICSSGLVNVESINLAVLAKSTGQLHYHISAGKGEPIILIQSHSMENGDVGAMRIIFATGQDQRLNYRLHGWLIYECIAELKRSLCGCTRRLLESRLPDWWGPACVPRFPIQGL